MNRRRFLSMLWIIGLVPICLIAWRWTVLLVGTKLEIGPETTIVTGPLTANGGIDYSAAIHQRYSEDVTPENNAAVLIDQAFGVSTIAPDLRAQYFQWLGIDPLPEQGDYVVTHASFVHQKVQGKDSPAELQETLFAEFLRAQTQPWARVDSPVVAEWLDANSRPLELIEQASRRSQYYSPQVTKDGMLQAQSTLQNTRESVRLLTTRAMLRLAEDDVAGAWSDLLACHRLAQLVGQRAPDLIALLVGVALDAAAARGDAALIAHDLTVAQAKACLAEHSQLPPFASLVETIDHGERLRELDAILTQIAASRLDVNVMMRNLNRMYDQIVAALKQPSHAARKQALDRIDIELNRRAADAKTPIRRVTRLVIDSRSTSSQSVSDSLVLMLMPMHLLADVAQSRVQVRRDLVRIGFALAAYRAERGNYPKDLKELVPEILVTLPLDRYTDKPLIYTPGENGFLVYSVGPNGVDDGGRESNGRNDDDIGLQVPIPHDMKQ